MSEIFEQSASAEAGRRWEILSFPPRLMQGYWEDSMYSMLQQADAVIVVVTPGASGIIPAREGELVNRFMERTGNRLPVFQVLAIRTRDPIAVPRSWERNYFNAKPLSVMGWEEREAALASLAQAVEDAVARTGKATAAATPDAPDQPSATGTSAAGSGVMAVIGSYPLAPPAKDVLLRAAQYAGAANPPSSVTTEMLLLAIAEAAIAEPEAAWTPEWLLGPAGEEKVSAIRGDLVTAYEMTMEEARPEAADGLSHGTVQALERARRIAARTTGTEEIHRRDLFAGLITDPRPTSDSGALLQFEEAGLEPAALREQFFEAVRGRGDDDEEWSRILLGRELRTYRMAGFHADDTGGDDLLGIEQDVLAFATLIAARTVTPPLSIGLFGEWGSGKSFFMRRLRKAVERLAAESARSGRMQRDLPFYKRIVQIEFNAWHYVEGNLWASLVEHIFRNLRVPGETATEALQKRLMDDLKFTEQARADAEAERRRAQEDADEAQRAVDEAKREHERQREELAELAAKDVAADLTREEVRAAVASALERLGIPAAAGSARGLLDALSEARAVVERGGRVFLPLFQAPPGERRRRSILLLLVLFLGPAVFWLVGAIVSAVGDAAMAQLSAFASGVAALLTSGAAWVASQVKWASARLAEVEKANAEVERRLAEKRAKQTREVRALEQALQLAKADYEAALRKQAEAETRVKEAEAKLDETSVARLLASFIEDRASSADYRKHLGVLALVRNDFETLSGLIEEENWRLSPAGHDDGRYPGKARFGALDEEEKHAASRINRIVLYIDDLDRCPPNKVVEVLQAVHLLLAFPLFVVVVGVDARWVKRSLEVRYRELLHEGDARAAETSSPEPLIGQATTGDYLEKIFQLPFWLRPMNGQTTSGMVRGLLAGSIAEPSPAPRSGPPARETPPAEPRPEAGTGAAPSDAPPAADSASVRRDVVRVPAIARETEPAPTSEEPRVNLESLTFRAEELEFIDALTPLLDRSPRALKRFVNVYRLIKAGLTREEQRTFHDSDGLAAPYEAVLFLLAVDTGLPQDADTFFAAIRGMDSTPLNVLLQQHGEWPRIAAWFSETEAPFNPSLALLDTWAARVARFSFRARS